MPETKTIQEGLSFNGIAERLGATKTLTLRITRGWYVQFERSQNAPDIVWVNFLYNGNLGIDGGSKMIVCCNIHMVDELYEKAKAKADATENVRCYGLEIYRNLSTLSKGEKTK